jgi:dTMP kinase
MAQGLKEGIFITFEGTEGSGKSTQAKMLCNFLKRAGLKVLYLREPGSTGLGEYIRKVLLSFKQQLSDDTELLLYIACRAQIADEKIVPALKNKMIVVCDRFVDATVAYQGWGLGIDIGLINRLNRFVTHSLTPDVTFFLDVDIREGLRRSRSVKGYSDRIERRSFDFHKRVRRGYLALAKKFPRRIKVISVDNNDKKDTQKIIRGVVSDVIKRYKRPG